MNDSRCGRKTRHGRIAAIAVLVTGGLAATAAVLASCGGHHLGLRHDPERMREMVLWQVGDVLDDIDASDAQRRRILAIAEGVVTDFQRLHEGHEQDHDAILAQLEGARPDAAVLHELIDRRGEELRQAVHRAADRALEAWSVLDRDQRAELVGRIREHIDDKR